MSGSLTQSERELLGRLGRESRSAKKKSPTPRTFQRGRPVSSTLRVKFIKAPVGGIPARQASMLGFATCEIWSRGGSGYNISATTEDDIEVLNWGVTAACATGDRYGFAVWYDKAWWIVSEDCSDEDPAGTLLFVEGSPDEGDGDTGSSDAGSTGRWITIESGDLSSNLIDYQDATGGPPPEIPDP